MVKPIKRVKLVNHNSVDHLFLVKRRKTDETVRRYYGVEGLQKAREFISGKHTLYITTLPADTNAVEQFVAIPDPVDHTKHLCMPSFVHYQAGGVRVDAGSVVSERPRLKAKVVIPKSLGKC